MKAWQLGLREIATGDFKIDPCFVYLLLCNDGHPYTGLTTNLVTRFACHQLGAGHELTARRLPIRPVAAQVCKTRYQAFVLERLSHQEGTRDWVRERMVKGIKVPPAAAIVGSRAFDKIVEQAWALVDLYRSIYPDHKGPFMEARQQSMVYRRVVRLLHGLVSPEARPGGQKRSEAGRTNHTNTAEDWCLPEPWDYAYRRRKKKVAKG